MTFELVAFFQSQQMPQALLDAWIHDWHATEHTFKAHGLYPTTQREWFDTFTMWLKAKTGIELEIIIVGPSSWGVPGNETIH